MRNKVHTERVIISNDLVKRNKNVDDSPMRVVRCVYSEQGHFIASNDVFAVEELYSMLYSLEETKPIEELKQELKEKIDNLIEQANYGK